MDETTLKALRDFLAIIGGRYNLGKALLYGSRARGTHHAESDADVAVLLEGPPQDPLAVRLDMADVAYEVMLNTGLRISPTPIWLTQWLHPQTYSNPALLQNIANDGILV